MICPKCNADIGEQEVCPNCAKEEAPAETTENVVSTEPVVEEQETDYKETVQPQKKSKAKIIAVTVAVAVVVAAVLIFVFSGLNKSDSEFVERTLFVKDNSLYYLEPKENKPILITGKFLKDEEATPNFWIMNGVDFTNKGNKVFYSEKIDAETCGFTLYYRLLNKSEEEPVKLAEDVTSYVVDDSGKNVIYLDVYGNIYSHNLVERKKIISETEKMWVSEDCTKILYLQEDGGLYIQPVDGEKDKIDSDVTSVYKTGDNFDAVYYFKEKDFYVKKTDADKVKIDSEILEVVMIGDDGDVYYTKENDVKGNGTLLDYVSYPEEMQASDNKIIDDYYYEDWRARNEALNRAWAKEVLEETKIETVDSLYYFNGESNDLINTAYVKMEQGYTGDNSTLIFKSYDNVDIKKISILDFVDALDQKHKFREGEKNNIFLDKNEYQALGYFEEFSKMVLGVMKSDATTYVAQNGKPIAIESEGNNGNFLVAEDGKKVYYIDNIDEEKDIGDLKVVTFADGAVESNDVYDTEVSTSNLIVNNKTDIIYTKDNKEEIYDLYINKELVEYDVGYFSAEKDGQIAFYTEYDSETNTGTLNVYSDGEKKKIAEEVYRAKILENGNVIYFLNYSTNSNKGDLYIMIDDEATRVDYDVTDIYTTNEVYTYNFVLSYDYLWSEIEIDTDNIEIDTDEIEVNVGTEL